MSIEELKKTPLWGWHRSNGAKMADFGGWDMPLLYKPGILKEHLATRRHAGLFDVCHMGRFEIEGAEATGFLQHVLSSDVASLRPGRAQYAFLPDQDGGVIDDVFLYCLDTDKFWLVVNAANRQRDWDHLSGHVGQVANVTLSDRTQETGMIALQGPESETLLESLVDGGSLPEASRNRLSEVKMGETRGVVARTGYTGEPVGFELFIDADRVETIWDRILEAGTVLPVGLGARDTLRLEAGLPLYGHELGVDPAGRPLPAFTLPLASVAVSFSAGKGEFVGRAALRRQAEVAEKLRLGQSVDSEILPRRIRPLAVLGKGIARHGDAIFDGTQQVGVVTSGTMAPYWIIEGRGSEARITDQTERRAIALACIDSDLKLGSDLEVDVRGRRVRAGVVRRHGTSRHRPYFLPEITSD